MLNKNVGRIAIWFACLAVGCLLIPVLSRANPSRQSTVISEPAAVLGVTPTKALAFTPKSVRDPDYPHELARDATGDTYGAVGLMQDQDTAFFLDEEPHIHTFGTGQETKIRPG